jgi:hypothetical protein
LQGLKRNFVFGDLDDEALTILIDAFEAKLKYAKVKNHQTR